MSPFDWLVRRHSTPVRPLTLKITVIVEPDEDRFHAFCPGLRGIHVDGSTVDEALGHAKDAVLLYLESLTEHGDPLPVGRHCVIENGVREEPFRVPMGAFLRSLELKWPSPNMSGTR